MSINWRIGAPLAALLLTPRLALADATLTAPEILEPGGRIAARVTIPNEGTNPTSWSVSYSLQTDSTLYAVTPPDPVYGADLALGCRSWTEADGKVIERGSLTDGKDYTDAGTPWINDHYVEAFQYVDLGRPTRIVRITYLAGDANHAWKLDVSASPDGAAYAPVAGLQGFDIYKRWGTVVLPLAQPILARYLRLRYHHDGQKVPVLRMPCSLSVYGGAATARWDLPAVGDVVGVGQVTVTAPPRSVGTARLRVDRPLTAGLYLLAARLQSGRRRELIYRHVMVLPAPLKTVSPESRFGINASNGNWARLLRRLGVGWVRFENLKWPFFSPEPGVYRFDGVVKPWQVDADAILKGYTDTGMSVLPFLFMTASYASSAPPGVTEDRRTFYPPTEPAQFAEFAYQVAARYGTHAAPSAALKTPDHRSGLGYLHYYEIWNESNLTDPNWGPWVGSVPQYLEMFRAAAAAVKRGDPTARVTNGGYAGIQVPTVEALRRYTYADGKRPLDFVDILNVHFYSGRVPPEIATDDFNANHSGDTTAETDFHRLAAWRDRWKPGMPLWLSETGYDSAGPYGTDERTQAARLPRVVMLALASGMDKVFVYRESGSDASMHAASGLLRNDGSYKPSWLTYATLIRELDGVRGGASRLPYPDPNVRLYAWRRGRDTLLTAWTIEGAARLALNLGRATVTDAFGRRTPRDLTRGLALSLFPVYIRGIARTAAVESLFAQRRQEEARLRRRRAWLARADAYLFKFGGAVEGLTLEVGRERPYTPVTADELYSDVQGYGFAPASLGAADRPWARGDLDRRVCRVAPGQAFRFRVRPGRYTLRVGVTCNTPNAAAGHLILRGAQGGDRTLGVEGEEAIVETAITATAAPLAVSLDSYGDLRWLTLLPQPPGK